MLARFLPDMEATRKQTEFAASMAAAHQAFQNEAIQTMESMRDIMGGLGGLQRDAMEQAERLAREHADRLRHGEMSSDTFQRLMEDHQGRVAEMPLGSRTATPARSKSKQRLKEIKRQGDEASQQASVK